jgi:hypothetical protein
MVFEGGKEYEGFLWAKAATHAALITVSLEDYTTKEVLASQSFTVIHLTADESVGVYNGFMRYNFSLIPSASTACVDITHDEGAATNISCGGTNYKSPIGHTCVRCAGQFKIALATTADVLVNYAFLQAGEWGRVPGISVLSSAADTLRRMGVKAIRQGGSYASGAADEAAYYQWQKWTGPAWTRPSRTNGVWKKCLLSGWGPFEMIDMCNHLDIEPIITTTESSTPDEFADLVEYCWGNSTTKMGAKRAEDGHPEQYRVRYFELGNEQYNVSVVYILVLIHPATYTTAVQRECSIYTCAHTPCDIYYSSTT